MDASSYSNIRANFTPRAKEEFQKGNFNDLELRIVSTKNGQVWSFKTKSEKLPKLFETIKNTFNKFITNSNNQIKYEGKELINILKDVASENRAGPLEVKKLALENKEIKGDSKVRQERIAKTKQRMLTKAAQIGKGLVPLEKQGIKGRTLNPLYWQEALQEKHQYSGQDSAMKILFKEWKKSNQSLSFDDWLQTDNIKGRRQRMQQHFGTEEVKYLAETERANYKVGFQDGKLLQNGQPLLSTASHNNRAIFVIDENRDMYAGIPEKGAFHHSSFLAGSATRGAGEIQTDHEGKIILISNKTGHYSPESTDPDPQVVQAQTILQNLRTLRFFKNKGVDLENVKFEMLNVDGSRVTYNAAEYLNSGGKAKGVW